MKDLVNVTHYLVNVPPNQIEYINFADAEITHSRFDPDDKVIFLTINNKQYNFKLNGDTLTFLSKYIKFVNEKGKNNA